MILSKHRTALKQALFEGGAVLRSRFGQNVETRQKESLASVVTQVDLEAEKAILGMLEKYTPDVSIISEECGFVDRSSRWCWVVDPLDGTSNFAAGLPWFGVLLALMENDTPVLAGMYLPTGDMLFTAEQGKGAVLNSHELHMNDVSLLGDSLVAYSFDYSENPGKTRNEMELLERLSRKVRNIRSTNSLYDFCFLAEGRLGAAINQTTKIWDIAAPWLIIREAGGMVTDIEGKEISFKPISDELERNYTIIAAHANLHPELISCIQS